MSTRAEKQKEYQRYKSQEDMIDSGTIKAGPLSSRYSNQEIPKMGGGIGTRLLSGLGDFLRGPQEAIENFKPPQFSFPQFKFPGFLTERAPRKTVTPTPTPTATPMPTPKIGETRILGSTPWRFVTPTPTPPVPDMSDYEKRTLETYDKYNIPRAVAYGIANAEGGKIGKNNRFNIGAGDANPQNAWDFDSDLAEATAASKLLSGESDKRYKNTQYYLDDPVGFLRAVETAGFAGDPATWKERSKSQGGAGNTYNSWSDFVMDTPSWKRWFVKKEMENKKKRK